MRNNHRTLIKIIFNPILRFLGFSIVSVFDDCDNFVRYEIREYPRYCRIINNCRYVGDQNGRSNHLAEGK